MDKYIITGGKPLRGEITVSGAKNVALKAIVAGLLTDQELVIENVPLITDLFVMKEIIEGLGAKVKITQDHRFKIKADNISNFQVPLEAGARLRTSSMVIGPLLCRFGKAIIPNPGGCRIGARPIDRHVRGIQAMGAKVEYLDGFFHAKADKLKGTTFKFEKNSHTGTETLILASVLADGETVIENVAMEPEVDDLIRLLNQMGAMIKRVEERKIAISGVKKLYGTTYRIMPDRNEVVTYAIGAIATAGDITVYGTQREYLRAFLEKLDEVNVGWEPLEEATRFFYKGKLSPTNIVTKPHPGFTTDWQAPWSVLALKANGISTIHETIYENRFGYVSELIKMGAKIEFFEPKVINPENFYNFNWDESQKSCFHAIKIYGPIGLHNAVLNVSDLRAGATLVLAALAAKGESYVYGVEHIDRGYEKFEEQLKKLGAKIKRIKA